MMDDGCPFLISHTFDARTSPDRESCDPRLHEDVETRRVQRIKGCRILLRQNTVAWRECRKVTPCAARHLDDGGITAAYVTPERRWID